MWDPRTSLKVNLNILEIFRIFISVGMNLGFNVRIVGRVSEFSKRWTFGWLTEHGSDYLQTKKP